MSGMFDYFCANLEKIDRMEEKILRLAKANRKLKIALLVMTGFAIFSEIKNANYKERIRELNHKIESLEGAQQME